MKKAMKATSLLWIIFVIYFASMCKLAGSILSGGDVPMVSSNLQMISTVLFVAQIILYFVKRSKLEGDELVHYKSEFKKGFLMYVGFALVVFTIVNLITGLSIGGDLVINSNGISSSIGATITSCIFTGVIAIFVIRIAMHETV